MAVLHPAVSRLFSNRIPASRRRSIQCDHLAGDIHAGGGFHPSSPGEAFTSITSGPRAARKISTPAASSPRVCVALMAMARSSSLICATVAMPPRCRLERKSPLSPAARSPPPPHCRPPGSGYRTLSLRQCIPAPEYERSVRERRRSRSPPPGGSPPAPRRSPGAFHQLHHQRRAAHHGDQIAGVIGE